MNQILNSEPSPSNNRKVNKVNTNNSYNDYDKKQKPSNKKQFSNDYFDDYSSNQYSNENSFSQYNNGFSETKRISNDKIVRIFAICMIIFAVGLISSGVYSYMSNQTSVQDINTVSKASAKIDAEEVDNKVKINVSDNKIIKQLVYSWNGTREIKIQVDEKNFEKDIDLPAGNNNLLISVIDENGEETVFEKSFESDNGVDIINPEISLEVVDSKLVITATDENALDFITYRWNDEDEVMVTPEDNEKEIKVELDIMKGENDITIVAVDKSEEKNTSTETKTFRGVTQPEIVIKLSADLSSLDITCSHEKGIKRIEYTLNDVPYEGDFDDSPTSVQFTQPLDVGYNRIIITAISVEDTKYTFDGETTYYPEGYDTSSTEETNE